MERQRSRARALAEKTGTNAYADAQLGPVLRGARANSGLSAPLRAAHLVIPPGQPLTVKTLLDSNLAAADLLQLAGLKESWLDSLANLRENVRLRSHALDRLPLENLEPPQLEKLMDQLASTQLQHEDYVQAYEGSLLTGSGQLPPWRAFQLPGVSEREARLFQNDFMVQLELVRSQSTFGVPGADAPGLDWDWALGKRGAIRSTYVAVVPDFHNEFEETRRHQAFVHLLAGILRERQLSGQWPISLAEMTGYQPLPELDRRAVNYSALGERMEVSWGNWNLKRPALRPR